MNYNFSPSLSQNITKKKLLYMHNILFKGFQLIRTLLDKKWSAVKQVYNFKYSINNLNMTPDSLFDNPSKLKLLNKKISWLHINSKNKFQIPHPVHQEECDRFMIINDIKDSLKRAFKVISILEKVVADYDNDIVKIVNTTIENFVSFVEKMNMSKSTNYNLSIVNKLKNNNASNFKFDIQNTKYMSEDITNEHIQLFYDKILSYDSYKSKNVDYKLYGSLNPIFAKSANINCIETMESNKRQNKKDKDTLKYKNIKLNSGFNNKMKRNKNLYKYKYLNRDLTKLCPSLELIEFRLNNPYLQNPDCYPGDEDKSDDDMTDINPNKNRLSYLQSKNINITSVSKKKLNEFKYNEDCDKNYIKQNINPKFNYNDNNDINKLLSLLDPDVTINFNSIPIKQKQNIINRALSHQKSLKILINKINNNNIPNINNNNNNNKINRNNV